MEAFATYLDAVTETITAGDFDRYRTLCDLPMAVINASDTWVIDGEDALRSMFDRLVRSFSPEGGAAAAVRVPKAVTRLEPGLLYGVYETHLFAGNYRMADPYESACLLRDGGGALRATMITNRIALPNWQLPHRDGAAGTHDMENASR